jgi:hypothetical protein
MPKKLKIFGLLILVMSYQALCSSVRTGIYTVKPKGKAYKEVFDLLVQAVLEADEKQVEFLVGLYKIHPTECSFNPHQKISFGYNLRHVASNKEIDDLLLAIGVAPIEKKRFIVCSSEVLRKYGDNIVPLRKYLEAVQTVFPGFLEAGDAEIKICEERDSIYKDARGFFPEDYDYATRARMANDLKKSRYI